MVAACYSCDQTANGVRTIRESIWEVPGWRVAHSFNASLAGWLVIVSHRHIESPDEMTLEESQSLGPLLRDASVALKRVTGCPKTYVVMFGEAEGFSHLHFHVVPRLEDIPVERRGPAVFAYLRETPLADDAQDRVSRAIRDAWPVS